MEGYGLVVKFPCVKINTPYGPIQIGGQCTPTLQGVTTNVTPIQQSSFSNLMPYLLLAGMAAAIALVVIKPKEKKEIKK